MELMPAGQATVDRAVPAVATAAADEKGAPARAGQQLAGASGRRGETLILGRRRGPSRQVEFAPPLQARFVAVDSSISGDCQVEEVSDDGARLQRNGFGPMPPEFFLMFTTWPKPVFRRCRTNAISGTEVTATFVWPQPEPDRSQAARRISGEADANG